MTRNEAANAKPIDQSMQEDPLEKKYPLESLTPQPQPHHVSLVTSPPQRESDPLPMKPCNAWFDDAKAMPPVTPLFDVFWLKGELTFLFGSAGIGKSILAVQILDAIAKGAKVQCFDGPKEPMRVGYFDFELSTRQFTIRYQDENGNCYKFSPNFFRAEYNARAAKIPKGMKRQDYILEQIEKKIIEHRLEVVAIDNLTALLKRITEPEDALEFMDKLVDIKLRYDISMLVIGHTPKRDLSKPLTEDDMSGSKQLINLCDSAFAIGKSMKESNVRYSKQIKARNVEYKYGSENVVSFRVVKNGCYLCFEHIGFDDEKEYLRARTEAEINELNEKIIALHQSDPNLSYAEIAKQLGTSKSKVARVIQKNRGVYNAPEPF
jgi:RecA-family ATPase